LQGDWFCVADLNALRRSSASDFKRPARIKSQLN